MAHDDGTATTKFCDYIVDAGVFVVRVIQQSTYQLWALGIAKFYRCDRYGYVRNEGNWDQAAISGPACTCSTERRLLPKVLLMM
ncbi:hypothetical protein ACHAXN_000298 [Cyclotella atomus]|jgi:hypothetical protein